MHLSSLGQFGLQAAERENFFRGISKLEQRLLDLLSQRLKCREVVQMVVYPKPADNSISAKTGKTAMNSATSSCHMAQGNALARFHRVRCSSV